VQSAVTLPWLKCKTAEVLSRLGQPARVAALALPMRMTADGHASACRPRELHPHRGIRRRVGHRCDPLCERARVDADRGEGVAAWTDHVLALGQGQPMNEIGSWMTGVRIMRYSGGNCSENGGS
jgi:hypothetical protein